MYCKLVVHTKSKDGFVQMDFKVMIQT